MKKCFCFFVALLVVFTATFSVVALDESVDIESRNTGTKSVNIDVFVSSNSKLYGGKCTLSFDENCARYVEAESDKFELDAFCENGEIAVVFSIDNPVAVSEDEAVFSVKLSRISDEDFDVVLKTQYMYFDDFSKREVTNVVSKTIEVQQKTDSKSQIKQDDKNVQSLITENTNEQKGTDDEVASSYVKIGKNKSVMIPLFSVVFLVAVFLLGVFITKAKYSKNNDNKVD